MLPSVFSRGARSTAGNQYLLRARTSAVTPFGRATFPYVGKARENAAATKEMSSQFISLTAFAGPPSQSATLTALPKGEPRGNGGPSSHENSPQDCFPGVRVPGHAGPSSHENSPVDCFQQGRAGRPRNGGPKGRRGAPVGLPARGAFYRRKSISATCQDLIRHALRARHLPLRGEGEGKRCCGEGCSSSQFR